MTSLNKKIILVTGASSGIGQCVCRELTERGAIVFGTARREDRLNELRQEVIAAGKGEFLPVRCDQRSEQDLLDLFQHIQSKFGKLDGCVINAGIVKPGAILNGSSEAWREMTEVNIIGTGICLRESVRLLRQNGNGHVVVIGSGLGHRVPTAPIMHFYAATKFAVRALTDAVRQELFMDKSKILVTHVAPGPVRTEAYRGTFPNISEETIEEALYGDYKPLSSKDIADTVLFILSAPPNVNFTEVAINPIDGESIPRPKNFT